MREGHSLEESWWVRVGRRGVNAVCRACRPMWTVTKTLCERNLSNFTGLCLHKGCISKAWVEVGVCGSYISEPRHLSALDTAYEYKSHHLFSMIIAPGTILRNYLE